MNVWLDDPLKVVLAFSGAMTVGFTFLLVAATVSRPKPSVASSLAMLVSLIASCWVVFDLQLPGLSPITFWVSLAPLASTGWILWTRFTDRLNDWSDARGFVLTLMIVGFFTSALRVSLWLAAVFTTGSASVISGIVATLSGSVAVGCVILTLIVVYRKLWELRPWKKPTPKAEETP